MKRYPISFHDWQGWAVRADGHWWLSPRQISDHLGLNWRTQLRKIDRSEGSKGVAIMATPSAGGKQQTLVLRLAYFGHWLLSINPGKIAPEKAELLDAMKQELLDVIEVQLASMFGLPMCEPEEVMNAPMPDWVRSTVDRATVLEARAEFLDSGEVMKAVALYRIGLPGTKTALLVGKTTYWARKVRRRLEGLGLLQPRKATMTEAPLPLFDGIDGGHHG